MPDFATCINNARIANGGDLTDKEADELIRRYNVHVGALNAAGHADPHGAGLAAVVSELKDSAAKKQADAAAAIAARDEMLGYAQTYRDSSGNANIQDAFLNVLHNIGFNAGRVGLAGISLAKFDLIIGKAGTALENFYRSRITGGRFNKPLGEDVAREMLGKDTGNVEAKGFGKILAEAIEDFRVMFNKAGGKIGKLDNWLPQNHNPGAVLRAGKQGWIDFIKPLLDRDRMVDPLSGAPLTEDRLNEVLGVAWAHITTGGWSDREPSAAPFGLGALVNQRQEHRFLHFKTDNDEWFTYNKQFGQGDAIQAVLSHFRSMAQDIAKLEVLGPNPNATIEWMTQAVKSEASKLIDGKPSLYAPAKLATIQDRLSGGDEHRLRSLYNAVTGADAPVSKRTAEFAGDVRNFLTGAQLGGASVLAAIQDPILDRMGRLVSGIPMAAHIPQILKSMFGPDIRGEALRAGFGLGDFFHGMNEVRYAGALGGSHWTRWLADRVVNLNGLEPWTQRRVHQFGLDFGAAVADRAKMSFDELGNEFPAMRRTFEDYGLGEKDWNKLAAVPAYRPHPDSAGITRPTDVAAVDQKLAERYLGMILGQTERTVPTSNPRASSLVAGAVKKGTVTGELAQSVLQYKAFSMSFMMAQWQAMQMVSGRSGARGLLTAKGAGYAGSLVAGMTFAGATALQLKSLMFGKDLQKQDLGFWIQALQYGGGLSLAGDFMLADVNRFGQSPVESFLGPTIGLGKDLTETLILNPGRALRGEKTKFGRDAVNMLGRYTPLVSSLPYTRAAYRRMIVDQLMYLADPEASQHLSAQQQSLFRDTGQRYFWPPGKMLPERAPMMSATGSRRR